MTLGDPLRQLSSVPEGVMIQDFTLRDDAYEALKLAAVYMKERYDRTHTHKHFNVGDRVYVTLHKGYDIPDTKTLGPKLSRQRTGPFKILERVGRLAYRLELPLHWRIHPVISIAHLEPAKEDPFDRPVPNHPDAVFSDEWEIERIVNKRTRRTKWRQACHRISREMDGLTAPNVTSGIRRKIYRTPVRPLRILKERKVPGKGPRQRVVVDVHDGIARDTSLRSCYPSGHPDSFCYYVATGRRFCSCGKCYGLGPGMVSPPSAHLYRLPHCIY